MIHRRFPVVDPVNSSKVTDVPRDRVLNAPDVKQVIWSGSKMNLLGRGSLEGDLNNNPWVKRLLIIAPDAKTDTPAKWVAPGETDYKLHVPYPRDQVGLQSLVQRANPKLLWMALLVFPITFLITSYRWHELLKALDIHIGQSRAFVLNMGWVFLQYVFAGIDGGRCV